MHAAGARPASTWRARSSASASARRVALRRRHHRRVVRRRQRRDGVASGIGGAGPDGADDDRRGRSSAASARASTGCCCSSSSASSSAGLMVGRTPEFLGKKIEAREVKLTLIGTIAVPLIVLVDDRARDRAPSRARRRSSTPGPRASPRRSTPTRRRPTTTARRSPATRASSSPTARTPAPSASRSPTCSAAWRCSVGRFLPLLAVLAVAGSLAGKRVAPPALGTLRTDTPTFVRRADRRGAARRAAHLRPRPAPRTRRPGPDRPALLMRARTHEPPRIAVVVFTVALGLAYPLAMTGVAQVVFPGKADGSLVERDGKVVGSQLIGQDFSQATDTALLPEPPVASRATRPSATFFNNQGPNQQALADQLKGYVDAYLKRERPVHAGPDRRAASRRTRSPRRPRASTRRSPRPTRASRPTASPRCAACRSRACCALVDDHASRPLFGARRRRVDQRARAQPRPRPGGRRDDRPPERSLFEPAILQAAVARVAAQARPARAWSATRSCSWSRSARCSPRVAVDRRLRRAAARARRGSRSPSRSGCG